MLDSEMFQSVNPLAKIYVINTILRACMFQHLCQCKFISEVALPCIDTLHTQYARQLLTTRSPGLSFSGSTSPITGRKYV